MSLPTSVQNKLIENLSDLLVEADRIEIVGNSFPYASPGNFIRLQQKALLILVQLEAFSNPRISAIASTIEELRPVTTSDFDYEGIDWYTDFDVLRNLIQTIKESLEADMLGNLADIIVASISSDYLLQAEQLLKKGFYIAAAVLIGGVLEDALRRLCTRQKPPIPLTKLNGDTKMLNALIDDLKAANIYSELKAKQLRAWAAIRNDAAHGVATAISTDDVDLMYKGVQAFLAEHLR